MAVLPIRKIGDPVLRAKAKPVEHFTEKTENLIVNLIDTMHDAEGLGLAATQIGVQLKVAVVEVNGELLEIINPEVTEKEGKDIAEEGCLSIPDRNGLVARPESIKLTAYNRHGEKYQKEFTGLAARAILHEIDHLDGVLFVDKMIDPAELAGMEG
ncbi:peptide deformylase [Halanaerobiaceae bacterium Z-7014]|uniref:Peptide deformylase n=1 Tax=Halonatronomonas betaini TaxID=2778430 RepID=A0A931F8R8_9FIRM|nr:peptide deformylase [Halonatronomonas betaini]MBF8436813.1 peptide deformylase [Halonatronomonas betaini]